MCIRDSVEPNCEATSDCTTSAPIPADVAAAVASEDAEWSRVREEHRAKQSAVTFDARPLWAPDTKVRISVDKSKPLKSVMGAIHQALW